MALVPDVKIGVDTLELRKLGLSDRMFSLLVGVVLGDEDTLTPEQREEARLIVETVLGRRLQASRDERGDTA